MEQNAASAFAERLVAHVTIVAEASVSLCQMTAANWEPQLTPLSDCDERQLFSGLAASNRAEELGRSG